MPDEGAPLTSAQPVAQCLTLFLRPFTRAFYNSSFCYLIVSQVVAMGSVSIFHLIPPLVPSLFSGLFYPLSLCSVARLFRSALSLRSSARLFCFTLPHRTFAPLFRSALLLHAAAPHFRSAALLCSPALRKAQQSGFLLLVSLIDFLYRTSGNWFYLTTNSHLCSIQALYSLLTGNSGRQLRSCHSQLGP